MFRRATTRIAATGALVTLATLVLFAVIARVATERIITADLDDELETLSVAIASDLEAGELQHEALRSGMESNILAYRLEHHSALLFDDARILGATGDLARRAQRASLTPFKQRGESPFTAHEPFTGHQRLCRFRVTHLHEHANGQTLVIFRSIESQARTLETIDGALALLVLAGAAAAAIILTIAIRRALHPVEKITAFTETITARNLNEQVRVDAAGIEFRRLADVINSLLARLAGSFDAQRRLVSDAAHELKTPVAVISAEAQELARGTLSDAEERQSLQVIGKAAAGLAREVDDLLELARGDAAAPRDHEVLELADIVDEAILFAAPMAKERNVGFVVNERANCTRLGDRAALVRAIANLLTNAARYSPVGSEVEIAVRDEEGRCTIEVADRGPGVPDGDRRRIFERFVRLAPARREHPDGAGLGLAIVDQVVRAHGGSVDVSGRDGGGALFRVVL